METSVDSSTQPTKTIALIIHSLDLRRSEEATAIRDERCGTTLHSPVFLPLFTVFFETRQIHSSFLVFAARFMSRVRMSELSKNPKKTLDKFPDSLYYMPKLWSYCVTTGTSDHGFIII